MMIKWGSGEVAVVLLGGITWHGLVGGPKFCCQ